MSHRVSGGSARRLTIWLVIALVAGVLAPGPRTAHAADPAVYDQVRAELAAVTYDSLGDIMQVRDRWQDRTEVTAELRARLGREPSPAEVTAALRTVAMDRLGLRSDFDVVHADLDRRVRRVVEATPFVTADVLRGNAKQILLGLTYLERYYDFEVGGRAAKDVILFDPQAAFGTSAGTPLTRLLQIGSMTHAQAGAGFSATTFSQRVHPTGASVTDWVSQLVARHEPHTTPSAWFRARSRAVVHEAGATSLLDTMAADDRLRGHLLPLLALSSASVYVISVDHAVTYGLTAGYGGADDPGFRARLEQTARAQQAFMDFWHRTSATPGGLQGRVVVVTDGMLKHPKDAAHDTAAKRWSPRSGPDADVAVREFFDPLGMWGPYRFIGGQASPVDRSVVLGVNEALSGDGVDTFTHETTHIFDSSVWLDGHGRRTGVPVEAYARGLFESVDNTQPSDGGASPYRPFFNLNTAYELGAGRVQNASPSRFAGPADIQQYLHGLMDVVYSLEVMEARATLALGPADKQVAFNRVRLVPDPSEANGQVESFERISTAEAAALTTLDQLVDQGIVAGRLVAKGRGSAVQVLTSNDYLVVPLYQPVYAGLQNDRQAVGDFLFRRYAHELAAEYGWQRGLVAYASGQHPDDAAALAAIMPEHGGSLAAFKKAMYAQRAASLDRLKPAAGFAGHAEMQAAMDQAVREDVSRLAANLSSGVFDTTQGVRAVDDLKHRIFRAYLTGTDDFRQPVHLPPAGRDLWVRNGLEGDTSGSGTEADPYQNLATALANARAGDTVRLAEDVTVTGAGASVVVDTAVTIDGGGHTLRLRGHDLELAADVTLRRVNLTLMKDGGASGTIYLGGHTVVLDQVTTRISAPGRRPHVVTGTRGSRASGPWARLTVTGATDETRFASITAGDLDADSATPVRIELDSRAVRVEDGIHLAPATTAQTGAVEVVTASQFVTRFRNPARPAGAGERSVTFRDVALSGVSVDDVDDLVVATGARLVLAESDRRLVVGDELVVEAGGVLDLGTTVTSTRSVRGAGLVRIGDEASLESTATEVTVSYEVYRRDFDYRKHVGKAYLVTGTPLDVPVRLLPEGAPYRLVKDATGTWRLEAADTAARLPVTGRVTLTQDGQPRTVAAGDVAVTVEPDAGNDPVDGVPDGEVPVGPDGHLDLGSWRFTAPGTYEFVVAQVARRSDVTYDAPLRLTVTVTEQPGADALVATAAWHRDGQPVDGLVFANTAAPAAPAGADPGGFVAVTPKRLLDTRQTQQLAAGQTITLRLRGVDPIPADAGGVALNITSTETRDDGFVIAWPTGGPQPASSNLNPVRGMNVPNHAIVAIGDDGTISLKASTATHLVVDLMGYYRAPAAQPTPGTVVSIVPARLVDTRASVAVAPGADLEVPIAGRHQVPADAAAAFVNLTVTEPAHPGWLAGYPAGQGLPLASNVNFSGRQTVANAAWLTLGEGGKVRIRNGSPGTVHVVVDVSAYAIGGTVTMHGGFVPVTPRRLLDTRDRAAVPAWGTHRLDLADLKASAVALNVTVTEPGAPGFIAVHPADQERPTASVLNYVPAQTVPNLTQVLLGADGAVAIAQRSPASAHVVVDLAGYYTP